MHSVASGAGASSDGAFDEERSFCTAVERGVDCKIGELSFDTLQGARCCDQRNSHDALSMPSSQRGCIASVVPTEIAQKGANLRPLSGSFSVYRNWIPAFIGDIHRLAEAV